MVVFSVGPKATWSNGPPLHDFYCLLKQGEWRKWRKGCARLVNLLYKWKKSAVTCWWKRQRRSKFLVKVELSRATRKATRSCHSGHSCLHKPSPTYQGYGLKKKDGITFFCPHLCLDLHRFIHHLSRDMYGVLQHRLMLVPRLQLL